MSAITFYSDLRSQPCRALFIFMKINNIPYDYEDVNFDKGMRMLSQSLRYVLLTSVLDMVENYFLASDEISIADIFAICEFSQIAEIGIDIGKNKPNIRAWRERVVFKLAPHYDEAHKPIVELCKLFNITEPF